MKGIIILFCILWGANVSSAQLLAFNWNTPKRTVKAGHKQKPVETANKLTYNSIWVNGQDMRVDYEFIADQLKRVRFSLVKPAADSATIYKQVDYFVEELYTYYTLDREENKGNSLSIRFVAPSTTASLSLSHALGRYNFYVLYSSKPKVSK